MPLKNKRSTVVAAPVSVDIPTTTTDVGVQTDRVIIKEYRERPGFPCSNCKRRFSNELDLAEHQRVQACLHLADKTYCAACDIQLGSKEALRSHILTRTHMEAILS